MKRKMKKLKQEEVENKRKVAHANQLSTLIEIEDMVKANIVDMMSFVEELDEKFEKEFEREDPIYGDLCQKIEQIKSKYSSIINN